MKVILIKDVARLGRKSEVKEVPDGHAHNFLIPKGFAIIATVESMKRLNENVKKLDAQKQQSLESFEAALKKLSEAHVLYSAEANDKGVLFKGVNREDIAGALNAINLSITSDEILLPHPIKELGVHEIKVARERESGSFHLEIIKK